MKGLYLIRPKKEDESMMIDMMQEWEQCGERVVPGILMNYKHDYLEFLNLLQCCHAGIGLSEKQVPSTLFILKNQSDNILGALSIRHYLTDDLKTMVDILVMEYVQQKEKKDMLKYS